MAAVIVIMIIALIMVLIVSYGVYRFVLYSPVGLQNDPHHIPGGEQYDVRKTEMLRLIDQLLSLSCERVFIRSNDGLRLAGDFYPGKNGHPLHICCHGYRGLGARDFCGGALALLERGDGVLLIHERGQGESQGHTMTFGIREREDVILWAQYCERRFPGTPLFLHGISMGAATVLMACALPLPSSIKGILADCPYDIPKDIIVLTADRMGISGKLIWPFLIIGAYVFARGLRFGTVCCHEAVRNTAVPVVIIHGTDDRFVPAYMSEAIEKSNPAAVRRFTFENAGHGLSYLEDTPRYKAITGSFIDHCLELVQE